jgi:cytochrome c oxidase cbb3-type subunit 3
VHGLSRVAAALLLSAAAALPQQQAPRFDAAVVERGRVAYRANCGFCHGEDATGGRAPDLIRSAVVGHDTGGDEIGPLIRNGRPAQGMPAFPALTAGQISDISTFLHSQAYAALNSAHVPADYPLAKLLTGNAAAGRAYFGAHCAGCHSPTGDLAGIARKYSPIELQQRMVYPAASPKTERTATVTLPDGQILEGRVAHADEFDIAIIGKDGWQRSWPRNTVKVEIHDPLEMHRTLTEQYTDADIHNLFAYLETLK